MIYSILDYGAPNGMDCPSAIQSALDACFLGGGGTVVIPAGDYITGGIRLRSNTTLLLEDGAHLMGSMNPDDYCGWRNDAVEPGNPDYLSDLPWLPPSKRNDPKMTMVPGCRWANGLIRAIDAENIAIIGEGNAVIDGRDCYDSSGEENYRGPHAIFFSCCENVLFEGYTARHSGNFLHEANNCVNVTMKRVTCLGGSDGIHLHCSKNTLIEDCLFKTGDDCIAGINVKDLIVRRCILNTSCNLFRIGGVNIRVQDCYAYGDGYYPHRKTVVKGKNDELPREQGRHNTLMLVDYFANKNYPEQPSDIHFKDCVFENIHGALYYLADSSFIQNGIYLGELTLENVRFTDLKDPSMPMATKENPLKIILKNVSATYQAPREQKELFIARENSFVEIIQKD